MARCVADHLVDLMVQAGIQHARSAMAVAAGLHGERVERAEDVRPAIRGRSPTPVQRSSTIGPPNHPVQTGRLEQVPAGTGGC
jgi:hypothetical protein